MPVRLQNNLGTNSALLSLININLTTTNDVLVGDLIIVFVGIGVASSGITISVTDSVGNDYSVDLESTGVVSAGFYIARCFSKANMPAGSTITATYSLLVINRLIAAVSFTGLCHVTLWDKAVTTSGSGGTWSSGFTLPTIQTEEMIIGGSVMSSLLQATSTPSNPQWEIHDFGSLGIAMTTSYKVVIGTGRQSIGGTWSNTGGNEARRDGAVTYRRGCN